METSDVVTEACRLGGDRLSRLVLLTNVEKIKESTVAKDYSFVGILPSWKEIEVRFDVSRVECLADVDAYVGGFSDDYRMTVELYFAELGLESEQFREVAEGFWKMFPDGEVVDLDSIDPFVILDSEKKQRWGYALALNLIKKLRDRRTDA